MHIVNEANVPTDTLLSHTMVDSYYANNNGFAPYSTSVTTLAAGVFAPVEVAHDNTTPVVALTLGDDGRVAFTLVEGDVTYVADTATSTTSNSYVVDSGEVINQQDLLFFSDLAQTALCRLDWIYK